MQGQQCQRRFAIERAIRRSLHAFLVDDLRKFPVKRFLAGPHLGNLDSPRIRSFAGPPNKRLIRLDRQFLESRFLHLELELSRRLNHIQIPRPVIVRSRSSSSASNAAHVTRVPGKVQLQVSDLYEATAFKGFYSMRRRTCAGAFKLTRDDLLRRKIGSDSSLEASGADD